MQVALNDEAEYAGGRLVFATSSGFEMPRRPAGTACTHTFEVVHGVTAMESGTRYSLFLCNTKGTDAPKVASLEEAQKLHYLVEPTLAQFQYFETAILLLRGTSDKQLAAAVGEYACFLKAHLRRNAAQEACPECLLGPAAELAWRGVLARCGAGHAWTLGLVQRPVVLSKLLLPWLSAVLDFCWVERVWITETRLTMRTLRVTRS